MGTSSRTFIPFDPPGVRTQRGGGREQGSGEGVTEVKEDPLLEVIVEGGEEEEEEG